MLELASPTQHLKRSLDGWRATIETMLRAVPDNRLEARGVIMQELGINPEPRELDAIVRLAHEPINQGALRELTCTALVVRVLAERSMRELTDPEQPCADSARRAATMVSGLLDTVDAWQGEVQRERETLGEQEGEFLLTIGEALLPEAESLITGSVLSPRLLAIMAAIEHGDLRVAAGGLSEAEAEAVAIAFGAEEIPGARPDSGYVVGVVLRTVIEDDVAAWEAQAGEAERDEALLDRMRKARTAYRYVTRLLKARESEAQEEGQRLLAEQLVGTQQELYGAYLKLLPILNPGDDGVDEADPDGLASNKLEALLRESAQLDSIADENRRHQVSSDKADLEAVKKLRDGEGEVKFVAKTRPLKSGGLRDERNRIKLGVAIAALLLAAVAVVYGPRLAREDFEPRIPIAEIRAKLELLDVITVGRMMHATTNGTAWRALDEKQRRTGVEDLAATATARGMQTLFVTDEAKAELALWTAADGVRLLDAPGQ
jgi:hypothetical protein